jgi:hypothetical protein
MSFKESSLRLVKSLISDRMERGEQLLPCLIMESALGGMEIYDAPTWPTMSEEDKREVLFKALRRGGAIKAMFLSFARTLEPIGESVIFSAIKAGGGSVTMFADIKDLDPDTGLWSETGEWQGADPRLHTFLEARLLQEYAEATRADAKEHAPGIMKMLMEQLRGALERVDKDCSTCPDQAECERGDKEVPEGVPDGVTVH